MGTNYGNQIAPVSNSAGTVQPINSNTTLTGNSYNKAFRVTGAYTVTLPSLAAGNATNTLTFFNDTAASNVTLAAQGTDTIRVLGNGQATLVIGAGESIILEHNGSSFSLLTISPLKANIASPTFTGTPAAPTAAQNTNTTQIATTAFVLNQAAGTNPAQVGIAQPGSGTTFARTDHVHPSTAPTPTIGDNSTAIATTAFVQNSPISKLQSISASVAGNSLTITYSGGTLDFRSLTATNGAPVTVVVPSNSITVPSGATLGTTSAQLSRLVVLEAYGGSTPILCVTNLNGAPQLDETNYISPTTISAAATSTGVIYSASAVAANSSYRVVGFIDITETTAGVWATAPVLVQGTGGQALASLSSLGYGQTWQGVTRTSGTTYYNLTGKPIVVNAFVSTSSASNSLSIQVDGVVVSNNAFSVTGALGLTFGTAVVPPGSAYVITSSGGGHTARELR